MTQVIKQNSAAAKPDNAQTLMIAGVGVAGCITVAAFIAIALIVIGFIVFLIWVVWLFFTNPYRVSL